MKILILTIVLAFSCQSGIAQGSDGYAKLVEEVMPSIVLINTFDSSGNGLKRGTGFCIAPGLFITNHHVIEGASRITIRTSDKQSYSVSLDASNKGADVAILKTISDIGVRPLKFASSLSKVGERIVVVGNPLGLTGTVSDGIVSAIRGDNEELIQITAPISQGSSGSPVINLRGDVIGVATMNLEGGQNLNFAVSSPHIKSLWPNKFIATSPSADKPKVEMSERWRFLTDEETTYDKQTLSKINDLVSVWITYREKDGSSLKTHNEINCSNRKIRRTQSVLYDNGGDVLDSTSVSADWIAIIPESNGESYFNVFCKGFADHQVDLESDDLLKKGDSLEKEGSLDAAANKYWQLLKMAADHRPMSNALYLNRFLAQVSLLSIYKRQENFKGLEKYYNFEISDGEDSAYVGLATLYKENKLTTKFRSAVLKGTKIFEQKVSSEKPNAYDFDSLADLYLLQQQDPKAVTTLLNGLKRFPHQESLVSKLGKIYNDQGRFNSTVNLIRGALPTATSSKKDLMILLKEAYLRLGDKLSASKIDAEINAIK